MKFNRKQIAKALLEIYGEQKDKRLNRINTIDRSEPKTSFIYLTFP